MMTRRSFVRSLLRRPFLVCCVSHAAIAALLLLSACTDPGLCYEADHPHSGKGVYINYEWQDGEKPAYIDSMSVLAVRLINHRKYGMVVSVDSLRGRFFYNAPPKVEAWVDPSIVPPPPPDPETEHNIEVGSGDVDPHEVDPDAPEPGYEPEPEPEAPVDVTSVTVDHFVLSDGTYKFFTMNVDTTEVRYTNIGEYLEAPGDGMQASGINMAYRTHWRGDPALTDITGDWVDYNPAFPYIQTEFPPIYIDSLEMEDIVSNAAKHIVFRPRQLTQQIDLNWVIRKDNSEIPFVIDSVKAEISGIPSRTGLFSGHLYLAKTYKMLFNAEIVDASGQPYEDTTRDDSTHVHARINVLSIVNNKGNDYQTGPGFLQILAYCRATDPADGRERTRTLQAIVNMHRELNKAQLIWYDPHGQYATKSCDAATIDLVHRFKIGGRSIISSMVGSEHGGIDVWVESDEGHDLEL